MSRSQATISALLLAALLAVPPALHAQDHGRVLEGRTFFSTALNREWTYTIYVPPDYETSERAYPRATPCTGWAASTPTGPTTATPR